MEILTKHWDDVLNGPAYCFQPFVIPYELRFSHTWMVAPTGTGKTNALEELISDDLPRVARGEASLFVMDSQNELIPRIAKLKAFAPGMPLDGRLVLLEPDPDYPLALNLFDMGNNAGAMIQFVMEALFEVGTTPKQAALFRYLIEAIIAVPNATLRDFKSLLSKDGYRSYREHIRKIDNEDVISFFESRFDEPSFKETKNEILWRLDALSSNVVFSRMFAHPKNKLDLAAELNEGKVVLVNANRELLKATREAFGRYMIALLLQAVETRLGLAKDKLPIFAYIDEASDYVKREENIAELLDKARKQKLALTLAHQRITQIESLNVRDALANCGIIFAGGNKTDAPVLAKIMRTEPEIIADHSRGTFSIYSSGLTKAAGIVRFEKSPLTTADWMTHEEERELKREMRERYCYIPTKQSKIDVPTPPTKETVADYQQWDDE